MDVKALLAIIILANFILTGCSTRDIHSELSGSSSQRLVTHSIDDLMSALSDETFKSLSGKKLFIRSYFLSESPLKNYADQRMATELGARFGAIMVDSQAAADNVMTVFYTSLGTDLDNFGITIPVGYVPGFDDSTYLNIITLEKFHGVSEMYYYVGPTGTENRSKVLQARVKTDALGLPFITIPLSNLDRHE